MLGNGTSAEVAPDVEIFAKAIRFALEFNEFYKSGDVKTAMSLIDSGIKRADALAKGEHPWSTDKGLVVRGYRSEIDGSAQPYGLEIPESLPTGKPVPLYVWLHGRGDTATDMSFIAGRMAKKGQMQPEGAIVLHAFGRQCIGYKSCGENDVFDAIESVKSRYSIDPNRVVITGFSMGGAGSWHLTAHHADQFAAGHAGAGFVDVVQYQKLTPSDWPWYEQKLWGVYDVPDYVRNLFNLPFIAYGGEIDPQRAGGEIMVAAAKAEGHDLPMLIGPGMGHKYHPDSLSDIMKRLKADVENGRDANPKKVYVQTRTLRYHKMFWASIEGLQEHWLDSRLDAERLSADHYAVTTKNVTRFAIDHPVKERARPVEVKIDGTQVVAIMNSASPVLKFKKTGAGWAIAPANKPNDLVKKPGLQGPIDDALMAPFLVVSPTGRCASPQVQQWVDFELAHFAIRWRALFRGDLRMKKDADVTDEDIRKYNLILWGDPQSNRLIGRVLKQLPITWTADQLKIRGEAVDAATRVPLLIYPNPLNPEKSVVLNSGPTFREEHDKTNSLQNPKLPDWAIIDVTTPPDGKSPGMVMDADFFDEQWKLRPKAAP